MRYRKISSKGFENPKEKAIIYRIIGFCTIIFVFFVWYTISISIEKSIFLPGPKLVFSALYNNFSTILLFSLATLSRVIIGFLIGALLGIIAGLAMNRSYIFMAFLDPLIEAGRPIPPIALIPFFILWFGLGNISQILLIALGCFMIIVVNTAVAVGNVSPIFIRAASSLGAKPRDIYRTVVIPAITPHIISGIRIAIAMSFGITVAAEYLGAQGGLGYLIRNARTTLNTEVILLGIILLGLESWSLDRIIRIFGSYLTRWSEKSYEA